MPKYSCEIKLKLHWIANNKKIADHNFSLILGDIMKNCPYATMGTYSFEREYTGKKATKKLNKLKEELKR